MLNDIEYVQPAIDRMTNLTSQLLAYAQGGKYYLQQISMTDIVRDTLPTIQHRLAPSLRIDLDLLADTWVIDADLLQMQMVLAAVLTNASEALEGEGHIRISTRNVNIDDLASRRYPELSPGSYVALEIEDNGKGMNEKTRQRLFEPFYTTKFQGRGLGMAAVFGIIKNHGGWIKVDSEPGQGASVTVFLPAVDDIPLPGKCDDAPVTIGTETILLVEDEEIVVEVSKEMLGRLGYQTLSAKLRAVLGNSKEPMNVS